MTIKKPLYIYFFVTLVFLIAISLFLFEGIIENLTGSYRQGTNNGEKQFNRIDYYTFLYYADEDLNYSPGEKERPELQPKPEPAPVSPSQQASAAPPAAGSAAYSQKEQQMVELINQARKSAGLAPLQVCSQLTAAARAKSKDMVDNNYFGHGSPTYGGFPGIITRFGISYRAAAENIAMNSNGSVSAAHNSLMGSPGHRANILGQKYNLVGVGIFAKRDGSHYYTQLFVGR